MTAAYCFFVFRKKFEELISAAMVICGLYRACVPYLQNHCVVVEMVLWNSRPIERSLNTSNVCRGLWINI